MVASDPVTDRFGPRSTPMSTALATCRGTCEAEATEPANRPAGAGGRHGISAVAVAPAPAVVMVPASGEPAVASERSSSSSTSIESGPAATRASTHRLVRPPTITTRFAVRSGQIQFDANWRYVAAVALKTETRTASRPDRAGLQSRLKRFVRRAWNR
jgi:hypothetical protein